MKNKSIAKKIRGKSNFLLILLASCFITTMLSRCTPEGQGPTDNYCTSGQSILTVDDSKVTTAMKNKIFASETVIGIKNPLYNKTGKTVVIPFETTDCLHNPLLTTSVIRSSFFASGTGSVTDFFNENSWGQFKLTDGGVSDLVVLNKAFTEYPFTESDWRLMTDLCQNSTIDWKSIDVNGDHVITQDEVQVVFTRSDGGNGATRPPKNGHSTYQYDYITITTPNWTGQIINRFVYGSNSLKGTTDPNPLEYNYSTIWHELCHAFFVLPDRYTSYCGTGSTGQYDLMSDNCSRMHINIYDKMRIGWIQPKICYTNVSSSTDLVPYGENLPGGCISLAAIESQPTALIRWTSTAPDEFWIFENRDMASSARGFENGLPESGLAVWWVDMTNQNVVLVDNSKGSLVPTAYKDQGAGALFKYSGTPSASIYSFTFYNKSNNLAFFLRSVSPPASTMYFSF